MQSIPQPLPKSTAFCPCQSLWVITVDLENLRLVQTMAPSPLIVTVHDVLGQESSVILMPRNRTPSPRPFNPPAAMCVIDYRTECSGQDVV